MKEEKEKEEQSGKAKSDEKRKVHVAALYTTTAQDKNFVAESDQTLQQVINEAYEKLGETRRPSDQFFCHVTPRRDLAPYMNTTLYQMSEQGVCMSDNGKGKLELEIDIDAEPGGAFQ